MPEGLRITLEALPNNLTVDLLGRQLLPQPFVFQCPPMEQLKVARTFTMGNYDTLLMGQYTRRGSRQLNTWDFDTLVMELGVTEDKSRMVPSWVSFPKFDGARERPVDPRWFVDQLDQLHDAGAPFHLTAEFTAVTGLPFRESFSAVAPVLFTGAVLLGFSETHKHGEADAIYLEQVSFSEWREPTIAQASNTKPPGGPGPSDKPPTKAKLRRDGTVLTAAGVVIPQPPPETAKRQRLTTLADLAKFYYHDPAAWVVIYDANGFHGGGPNTAIVDFPRYGTNGKDPGANIPSGGATLIIPALPPDFGPGSPGSLVAPGGYFDPLAHGNV